MTAAITYFPGTLVSISANVVTITPDMANELLSRNTHNRNVKRNNLGKVVRALQNGEWKLNGEAIKVAKSGRVLDGQHRLHAIAETGISMTTLLIEGLEDETQETMDGGSPRTAADVLSLRGESSASALASIAKRIAVYNTSGLKAATYGGHITTTAEIIKTVETTPGIRELVKDAMSIAKSGGLTASTAGLLLHVFGSIDAEDSDYFFEKIKTGEMLSKGDPIYALREGLANVKSVRGQKSMTFVAAISVKAWNKFRAGEKNVAFIRFVSGGANPETFPTPQ